MLNNECIHMNPSKYCDFCVEEADPDNPKYLTRDVFLSLSRLPDKELDRMLNAGGVKPCRDRSLKLQQAMVRWFYGNVPSENEMIRLLEGCPRSRE